MRNVIEVTDGIKKCSEVSFIFILFYFYLFLEKFINKNIGSVKESLK